LQICTERDDVPVTARRRPSASLPVTDVRVFTGRNPRGVRGVALPKSDKLISRPSCATWMSTPRNGRLSAPANAVRRGGVEEEAGSDNEEASGTMGARRAALVEMSAASSSC